MGIRVAEIETPEKIVFRYVLADMGSRAIAWLVDVLIQLALELAALFAISFALDWSLFGSLSETSLQAGLAIAFWYILLFLMKWGYFVFFESVMRGSSPGKRAMGISVVRADGEGLDFEAIVVRNLLRAVDDFPVFPIVAFVAVLMDRRGQRLGDMAAGTLVVRRARADAKIPQPADFSRSSALADAPRAVPADADAIVREVLGTGDDAAAPVSSAMMPGRRLTESELFAIRKYSQDRSRIPPALAATIGARLAAEAAQRTGLARGVAEDDFAFLERVYKAHAEADS